MSDIVALMTFEHQTQMINFITRLGWEARIAAPSGEAQTQKDVDALVEYMLFAEEAPLKQPIEGVSEFHQDVPTARPEGPCGPVAPRFRSANAFIPVSAQLYDLQRRFRRAARRSATANLP